MGRGVPDCCGMDDMAVPKSALHHYLQDSREALVWKLEGLSEREARLPRTPTGNNLLGLVKHSLNVEAGYFGPTFGREFPELHELVSMEAYAHDPQADWYATPHESKEGLVDLYRRVWRFADGTITALPLDAKGSVPWWRRGSQEVTLQRILIHVTCDLARHAGHADIMREQHDEAVGHRREDTNVPDGFDWPAYVAKLGALADQFS